MYCINTCQYTFPLKATRLLKTNQKEKCAIFTPYQLDCYLKAIDNTNTN